MALPDFFVIGAPDAGTEVLHEELGRHRSVFMSEIPQPGYFLAGRILESGLDVTTAGRAGVVCSVWDKAGGSAGRPGCVARAGPGERSPVRRRSDYEALFDAAPAGAVRGESTPYYLADFTALRHIHELLPYAKLIVVLRDPVERAYANWVRMRLAGLEDLDDFERAVAAEAARTAACWPWPWRYLALGRYGTQLQRLFTLFPREQVLLTAHRDLIGDPAAVIRRAHGFLGVKLGVKLGVERRGRPGPPGTPVPTPPSAPAFPAPRLDPAIGARLRDGFRSDIALLSDVTRRRFDEWLVEPADDS